MSDAPDDPFLQEAVNDYLLQLREGNFESAFHGLIDLDPGIVKPLIAAYHAEPFPGVRNDLFQIIREFRSPLALSLLEEVLRDRRFPAWKDALDGLVALASPEAVRLLDTVLLEERLSAKPDPEFMRWMEEALEQAKEALSGDASAGASPATE